MAASAARSASLVERMAEGERWIVLAALALVAMAGLYLTVASGDALMRRADGGAGYLALLFVMWWTMMMAMMLPTAAPAILTYAGLRRRFIAQGASQPPLAAFVAGYAAVWTAFSAAACLAQWLTAEAIALTPMYALMSRALGGALLIAAGLYQFTPLKDTCLRRCQSPFFWLAHRWRNDMGGALRLGFGHGLYCLGCCWVLMLLLFYGGVMELTWIAGLAAYVAIEKLVPLGSRLNWLAGAVLMVWGCVIVWPAVHMT
jgi:predicted metal-binding membrane protein